MNDNKNLGHWDVEDTIHYKRGKNYYVGAGLSA